MTSERDSKSGRTGQPDLLASLPAESPPASRPAPGIDPAVIEELLTEVRNLREQVAGLKEAVSTERSAAPEPEAVPQAVPEVLTPEALEAWGDTLVARVAEAGRSGDNAAAAIADHTGRIGEAAAKAAAAAERIDRGMETTADRVAAEIKEAVTTIETGLQITRERVRQQFRLAHETLDDIRTQTAGPRFGLKTILVWLIVFVLGMLLESRIHTLYRWLWSG